MPLTSQNSECHAQGESPLKTEQRFSSITIALPIWALTVVGGAVILLRYSFSGNFPVQTLEHHSAVAFADSSDGTTRTGLQIFAFLHPRCPCSRATVTQLARTSSRRGLTEKFQVVFFCPADKPDAWAQQELWQLASACSGLQCSIDHGGRRTAQFGVRTSGHVLAFDSDGRKVFSGGITPSRGHEGKCLGSQLLEKICDGHLIAPVDLPVFGCEIVRSVAADGSES